MQFKWTAKYSYRVIYWSPTYLTLPILVTIRIYRSIPLPEDFYSLWKKLWKITCVLTVSQWHIICGYCWCSGQWWCIPKASTLNALKQYQYVIELLKLVNRRVWYTVCTPPINFSGRAPELYLFSRIACLHLDALRRLVGLLYNCLAVRWWQPQL